MFSQFSVDEIPPSSGIPAKSSQPAEPAEFAASSTSITRKTTDLSKGLKQPWEKYDVEKLVSWMEENQEKLRGKQAAWHKDVKEEVFGDNDDMTVKRIREKHSPETYILSFPRHHPHDVLRSHT